MFYGQLVFLLYYCIPICQISVIIIVIHIYHIVSGKRTFDLYEILFL